MCAAHEELPAQPRRFGILHPNPGYAFGFKLNAGRAAGVKVLASGLYGVVFSAVQVFLDPYVQHLGLESVLACRLFYLVSFLVSLVCVLFVCLD